MISLFLMFVDLSHLRLDILCSVLHVWVVIICMGSYSLAFLNFQFSKRVSGISNTLGLGIKFITSKLILIILG
jgi:hypothetical protein